jgi:tetratricopeptide (TPR) repeat protein
MKIKKSSPKMKNYMGFSLSVFLTSVLCLLFLASLGYADSSADSSDVAQAKSESLAKTESSSEQPPLQDNKNQSHQFIANSPTTNLGKQLWQARITNPKDENSNENRSELYQLIEKIRSVGFEPQDKPAEPLFAVEPTQKTEPADASSDTDVPKETKHKKIGAEPPKPLGNQQQDKNQLPYRSITDETLQMLKELPQHSEQLKNPAELADILFHCGHLKEAAKCYKEALNRMPANEDDRNENRAWVLFQTGNCLQKDDPSSAVEMYRQLIAEYPDSLWADLAKALSNLTNWYQQDKPWALAAENRP